MSQSMKYLTPKTPITEIERQRAEEAESQNIDLYEAVTGLWEEFMAATEQITALEERVKKLEGGQQK